MTKRIIVALMIVAVLMLGLVACGEETGGHSHSFAQGWTSDGNGKHYHTCTGTNCTAKSDEEACVDADGDFVCDKCGYVMHTHSYSTSWTSNGAGKHYNEPTCSHTELKGNEENCADVDKDGACDKCGYVMNIAVEKVNIDKEELNLYVGDFVQLVATVLPVDSSVKTVEWYSSDEEVATVDEYGIVTAEDVGECVITVKTVDGEFTATCVVNVINTMELSVVDNNGFAVSGVPVKVGNQSVISDENGKVTVEVVAKRIYTATVGNEISAETEEVYVADEVSFTTTDNVCIVVEKYSLTAIVEGTSEENPALIDTVGAYKTTIGKIESDNPEISGSESTYIKLSAPQDRGAKYVVKFYGQYAYYRQMDKFMKYTENNPDFTVCLHAGEDTLLSLDVAMGATENNDAMPYTFYFVVEEAELPLEGSSNEYPYFVDAYGEVCGTNKNGNGSTYFLADMSKISSIEAGGQIKLTVNYQEGQLAYQLGLNTDSFTDVNSGERATVYAGLVVVFRLTGSDCGKFTFEEYDEKGTKNNPYVVTIGTDITMEEVTNQNGCEKYALLSNVSESGEYNISIDDEDGYLAVLCENTVVLDKTLKSATIYLEEGKSYYIEVKSNSMVGADVVLSVKRYVPSAELMGTSQNSATFVTLDKETTVVYAIATGSEGYMKFDCKVVGTITITLSGSTIPYVINNGNFDKGTFNSKCLDATGGDGKTVFTYQLSEQEYTYQQYNFTGEELVVTITFVPAE